MCENIVFPEIVLILKRPGYVLNAGSDDVGRPFCFAGEPQVIDFPDIKAFEQLNIGLVHKRKPGRPDEKALLYSFAVSGLYSAQIPEIIDHLFRPCACISNDLESLSCQQKNFYDTLTWQFYSLFPRTSFQQPAMLVFHGIRLINRIFPTFNPQISHMLLWKSETPLKALNFKGFRILNHLSIKKFSTDFQSPVFTV